MKEGPYMHIFLIIFERILCITVKSLRINFLFFLCYRFFNIFIVFECRKTYMFIWLKHKQVSTGKEILHVCSDLRKKVRRWS